MKPVFFLAALAASACLYGHAFAQSETVEFTKEQRRLLFNQFMERYAEDARKRYADNIKSIGRDDREKRWVTANGARYYPERLLYRSGHLYRSIDDWQFEDDFDDYRCIKKSEDKVECRMAINYEEKDFISENFDDPSAGRTRFPSEKKTMKLKFTIDTSDYKFRIVEQERLDGLKLCGVNLVNKEEESPQ
jgi:hypothetical protein